MKKKYEVPVYIEVYANSAHDAFQMVDDLMGVTVKLQQSTIWEHYVVVSCSVGNAQDVTEYEEPIEA